MDLSTYHTCLARVGARCSACRKPLEARPGYGRCGACRVAVYCDAACQARAWRTQGHNRACALLQRCVVADNDGDGDGDDDDDDDALVGVPLFQKTPDEQRGFALFQREVAAGWGTGLASQPATTEETELVTLMQTLVQTLPTLESFRGNVIRYAKIPSSVRSAAEFANRAAQAWATLTRGQRRKFIARAASAAPARGTKRAREDGAAAPAASPAAKRFRAQVEDARLLAILETLPGDIAALILAGAPAAVLAQLSAVNRRLYRSDAVAAAWNALYQRDFRFPVGAGQKLRRKMSQEKEPIGRRAWAGFTDAYATAGPALDDAHTQATADRDDPPRERYLSMLQFTARKLAATGIAWMLRERPEDAYAIPSEFHVQARNEVMLVRPTAPRGEDAIADRVNLLARDSPVLNRASKHYDDPSPPATLDQLHARAWAIYLPGFDVTNADLTSLFKPHGDSMSPIAALSESTEGWLAAHLPYRPLGALIRAREAFMKALVNVYATLDWSGEQDPAAVAAAQNAFARYLYAHLLHVDPHMELRLYTVFSRAMPQNIYELSTVGVYEEGPEDVAEVFNGEHSDLKARYWLGEVRREVAPMHWPLLPLEARYLYLADVERPDKEFDQPPPACWRAAADAVKRAGLAHVIEYHPFVPLDPQDLGHTPTQLRVGYLTQGEIAPVVTWTNAHATRDARIDAVVGRWKTLFSDGARWEEDDDAAAGVFASLRRSVPDLDECGREYGDWIFGPAATAAAAAAAEEATAMDVSEP